MKELDAFMKKIIEDPELQSECIKCGHKMFYQLLNPRTGRCLSCPSPIMELLAKIPAEKKSYGPKHGKAPLGAWKNLFKEKKK